MSMVAGFPWVDKTRRRSCHLRNDESSELGVFEAERYYSTTTDSLGRHRGTSLSQKMSLPTKDAHGRSTRNWRDLGRASLDIPMLSQSKEAFLDTINQTKDNNNNNNNKKKKKQKPSSPGGKLASFFNSLISQAVSKKKKSNKPSRLVKDNVVEDEEESISGWRRMRRSSMSHFRSSLMSSRPKRTSMSDVDAKSIDSCPTVVAGFQTPPLIINTKGLGRHVAVQESKGFKRFAEEDDEGGESDSSSDLFELKLSFEYDRSHHLHRHHLGYCGGDLPVYETTHMDIIKMSSRNPIANGLNRDF